ncbi:protein PIN-LIKES 3-like [Arachis stenosperma]|uniref:protein PIN-LIKES 3-like n=1 Tax=Arachis stenosperma TaxID=217475 RepID=UPI0025ABE58E|nr:protein PIN-LIKES 3-like [Arachis stenosperma]
MELWKLFMTALMPVLKLIIITAVGAFLALDRFNLLRDNARKHLNALVYYVFIPALICSILTKSITFRSLVILWFMPMNILLTFIAGSALGWLLMKVTKAPHNLQGLVLGCCAGGNLGNLPLIVIPSVCKQSSSPFGDVDVCYQKAMAYVTLSLAVGCMYFWTIVYSIVRAYSCKVSSVRNVDDSTSYPLDLIESDPENHTKPSNGLVVTLEEKTTFDVGNHTKLMETLKKLVVKLNLNILLTPATIAVIVGSVIGVIPQLRKLFIGENAPLRVVQDSTSMLGDACIPAITLLVGATLLQGLKGSGIKVSIVIGIIAVRFIALPMLGVGIVKGAVHFGVIHHDPLYHFTLLFQYAVPPAVSMSTITQFFGAGETECSIIMLATYACASVSVTVWSTIFMWIVT